MLTVEINQRQYSEFVDINVSTSLENFAWGFSFAVTSNISGSFPIKIGDNVKIFADGELIFTGYVEKTMLRYTPKSHTISVSGRSWTADFVDSTIDGTVGVIEGDMIDITRELIKNLFTDPLLTPGNQFIPTAERIPEIILERNVSDFGKHESLSEEIGTTYFEVLEKLAIRRQFFLNTDANSNIVFANGAGFSSKLVIRNMKNSRSNNIIEATFIQDRSKMFYLYSFNSQPVRGGYKEIAEFPPDQLFTQNGRVIDRRVDRFSRKLYLASESPSDQKQCEDRAKWEATVRASRSMKYKVTVQGHSYNNEVWTINKLASVRDEFADLDASLLINDVKYTQSAKGGSRTSISMLPPNALTFPEKPIAKSDVLGDKFLKPDRLLNIPPEWFTEKDTVLVD